MDRSRKKHYWNSGKNTLETTDIQLLFLCPGILANQAITLNQFPETSFILPTNASAAKRILSAYEIQITGEISISQKVKGWHCNDRESSKECTDKS